MLNSRAADVVLSNLLFSISQVVIHSCLPQVILLLVCEELGLSGTDCDGSAASAKAGSVTMLCSLVITIPGLLVIAFYGSFADRYGLKQTLLVPVVGNFLYCGCILLAMWPSFSPYYVYVLLLGSLCSGLSGSRNSFIMASFTYAAVSSPASERSEVFSFIESAIFSARIIGPLLVGEISKHFGFASSLEFGMSVCVVNLCWIVLRLREPVLHTPLLEGETGEKNKNRDVKSSGSVHCLGSGSTGGVKISAGMGMDDPAPSPRPPLSYHPLATVRKVRKLFGGNCLGDSSVPYISFAFFLYYMCTLGETSIEILFQKRMFHFSAETIGYFGSLSGVMQCLSMLAMPPLFFRVFGSHLQDITWAQMGLCWKALYYALFGLAQRGEQLFLVLLLLLFCGPIVPRTRSYLSKAVRSTEQTELFVAIAALEALGAALGPSLTFGYAYSVSFFPGLMFELTALICAVSALVVLYVRTRMLGGSLLYTSIALDNDCGA